MAIINNNCMVYVNFKLVYKLLFKLKFEILEKVLTAVISLIFIIVNKIYVIINENIPMQ